MVFTLILAIAMASLSVAPTRDIFSAACLAKARFARAWSHAEEAARRQLRVFGYIMAMSIQDIPGPRAVYWQKDTPPDAIYPRTGSSRPGWRRPGPGVSTSGSLARARPLEGRRRGRAPAPEAHGWHRDDCERRAAAL